MTISFSFGKYGGFYIYWGYTKRICFGWVAITLFPFDLDEFLRKKTRKQQGVIE